MIIDISIGNWSKYATHLDDVAYSIFVERTEFKYKNKIYSLTQHTTTPQELFIYNRHNSYIEPYYKKAINLIRKEKLNKLNDYK